MFGVASLIGLLGGCFLFSRQQDRSVADFMAQETTYITSLPDAMAIFPKTVKEIECKQQAMFAYVEEAYQRLLAVAPGERTFKNTMQVLDSIESRIATSDNAELWNIYQAIELVHPDAALRESAKKARLAIKAIEERLLESNRAVYQAICDYAAGAYKTETLTPSQTYYVEERLQYYKRKGMHLSDEALAHAARLSSAVGAAAMAFESNIAADTRSITVSADGLAGVRASFIATLDKNTAGEYILKCDYPTCGEIMPHCSVEDTRRRYSEAFGNRAVPANLIALDDLIAKRDQYAKALGFESYATYELSGEMVKTPERAMAFLDQVAAKARKKAADEVALLKTDLPAGVTLDEKGRFKSWDWGYVEEQYIQKHFNVDQREIAEYFPVDKALEGVFAIYQKFLGLRFAMVKPGWAWHDDVRAIEVYDAETNILQGFVALDLYPRKDKYTHACCVPLKVPLVREEMAAFGGRSPAFTLVIANFPQATKDAPALFKHADVQTFFHEFGHAMHFVLSATQLQVQGMPGVKRDFIEMPSQMFEEWLYDRDCLKQVSCHYKTGEPLPDSHINALIQLKNFSSGGDILSQVRLAYISLLYFGAGQKKDTDAIRQALTERFSIYTVPNPAVHPQAAFGHLGEYGARYYGYLWSKVFALDLFQAIKERGLLQRETGKAFVDALLGRGATCDPNEMLTDFLGREPNVNAFFKDLGFKQ